MRWGCYSAQCYSRETRKPFEFESNVRKCPQCGATQNTAIAAMLTHHYLIADNKTGRISGRDSNYRVACNSTAGIAHLKAEYEMATDEVHVVTCTKCMESPEYKAMLKQNAKHEDYLSMLNERQLELLGSL